MAQILSCHHLFHMIRKRCRDLYTYQFFLAAAVTTLIMYVRLPLNAAVSLTFLLAQYPVVNFVSALHHDGRLV